MTINALDPREFERTYFALRAALVLCCLMVLAAPVSILIDTGDLPPSISDSWHEGARMPFVFGLVMASVLLLCVAGDTLFEHTMLKAAGMFGLMVAAMPCWPKRADGTKVCHYPSAVAHEAVVTIAVFLTIAVLALAAGWFLAERIEAADPARAADEAWKVTGWKYWLLVAIRPLIWTFYAAWFLVSATGLVHTMHFTSAVLMFVCLGLVALARTRRGLRLLEKLLGDVPVDRAKDAKEKSDATQDGTYDKLYAGIALSILAGFVLAAVLALSGWHWWVLVVEFVMLGIFGAFWIIQTLEAIAYRSNHPAP